MALNSRTIERVSLPITDGPGLDAFARARMSSPATLLSAEVSTDEEVVTGGITLLSGYLAAGGAGQGSRDEVSQGLFSRLPITLDAAGTSGTQMSLLCQTLAGAGTAYGSLNWREAH